MVLGGHMKRAAYIAFGATGVWLIGVVLLIPMNQWYTSHFVKGEADVGPHLWFSLFVIWPLLFVLGGVLGNWLYHRNLTRRSNGTREQ
jgi:hypothetical protein